ncbi:MAG: helix-turn-helix domain containing protein [Verrucomicrobiales bacterium]|nr:helix-turn-helix domain containing protein [Verrucomicrobiales bacterium]
MDPATDPSAKRLALQHSGTFNPRAERVRHSMFQASEFFDPGDLLQLKYEALRALKHDGYSIARAAQEFGLSRPTIYQAQRQFQAGGLEALLPGKRGPKGAHKLTAEVREFIADLRRDDSLLAPKELAARVHRRFALEVHPRTIEKAFHPKVKRGLHRHR